LKFTDDETKNNALKSFTIKTGIHNSALGQRTYTTSNLPKRAMTTAMRGMSLANRADIDYADLLQMAIERCKTPIKLSWDKVEFEAEVRNTAYDR